MAAILDSNAKAIAQALLDHHRRSCRPVQSSAEITDAVIRRCLVSYDEIIALARVNLIPRGMGVPLRAVARWCVLRDWPPLPSLVVRSDTRKPGDGYENTPGLSGSWEIDVRECIAFKGYREKA